MPNTGFHFNECFFSAAAHYPPRVPAAVPAQKGACPKTTHNVLTLFCLRYICARIYMHMLTDILHSLRPIVPNTSIHRHLHVSASGAYRLA